MTHIEEYNTMIERGVEPCFEVEESVYYIEPTETGFNVGTACNVGLIVDFHYEYDTDFSFDENLQAIVEECEQCKQL